MSRKRREPARLAAGVTGRRSIRLGGYDYSRPGTYFVTVCAARRGYLFGWISDGRVVENENATIVRDCWFDLPNHYPHGSLDACVVMLDHVHGIVMLHVLHAPGPQTRPLQRKFSERAPRRTKISAAEETHVSWQRVEVLQVAARPGRPLPRQRLSSQARQGSGTLVSRCLFAIVSNRDQPPGIVPASAVSRQRAPETPKLPRPPGRHTCRRSARSRWRRATTRRA